MRSSTIFASALAFAASAFAQVEGYAVMTEPTEGFSVPSGQTFNIKWEAGKYTGPATIVLLGGESPTTLVPGATLATVEVADGEFAWAVDCSLGKEKTYGLRITSSADAAIFQYSFPFTIAGPSCSSGAGSGSGSSAGSYPTLGSSSASSAVASSTGYIATSSKVSSSSVVITSTSAPAYPTSSAVNSSSSVITSYSTLSSSVIGNLSTTAIPSYSATTISTSTSAAVITPSTTSSVPVPTSGANGAAAGSVALVGALAFAVLAM